MFMLMIGMAAMTLTSCLNDDDDDTGLSKQEVETAYRTVAGPHSGKLKYVKSIENNKAKNDSVDASCNFISDSVVTISNVPVSQIAQYVQYNDSVKKYLALVPNQELKCQTYYVKVSPVQIYVNPYLHNIDLHYGGKTHRLAIQFAYMNNYSYAAYLPATKEFELQIIVQAVYVDPPTTGFGTNLISVALPYYFQGN